MTERAPATENEDDTAFGRPISGNRQEYLQSLLARQQAQSSRDRRDQGKPFAGVKLSGADVSWLLGSAPDEALSLEGARLFGAHLENAQLAKVCLKSSNLIRAHLEATDLSGAQLAGADLTGAYLRGADLSGANLVGADLSVAQLQGTLLEGADLRGAQLYGVTFDRDTRLAGIRLGPGWVGDRLDRLRLVNRNAALAGVRWQDAHLGGVPWGQLRRLGGYRRAPHPGRVRGMVQYMRCCMSPSYHFTLARAYRRLAAELQQQGLPDPAERFAGLARKQERLARWLNGAPAVVHDRKTARGKRYTSLEERGQSETHPRRGELVTRLHRNSLPGRRAALASGPSHQGLLTTAPWHQSAG